MADKNEFTTTRDLEQFIRRNPKQFLELMGSNPEFRDNAQRIMKDWNQSQLISVAHAFQPTDYREPLSNRKMVVLPFAHLVHGYLSHGVEEMKVNPHFKMESIKKFEKDNPEVARRMQEYEEQYKKRLEKHKKHIQKQLEHTQAEISRHNQIEFYIEHLHKTFIQMFANKNTFTEVSNWAAKNGVDLQAESQATENSLKTNRMDLFAKVQRIENAIEEGYAKNPDANYHRMPKDEQIAHKKALAQNVVMINEVYEKGSQEDKRAIKDWLLNNGINPEKLKEGMTISDLIYQEAGSQSPKLYFQLGKKMKDVKNNLSNNAKEIVDVFDATTNKLNLENVAVSRGNIVQEQENERNLQMSR